VKKMKEHLSSQEINNEGREKVPTIEEILNICGVDSKDFIEPPKELNDEQGIYYLEIKIKGEKEGEVVSYEYRRKGEFPEGHKSSGTSIHIATYDNNGDFIRYPDHIAEYDDKKKEWNKL